MLGEIESDEVNWATTKMGEVYVCQQTLNERCGLILRSHRMDQDGPEAHEGEPRQLESNMRSG